MSDDSITQIDRPPARGEFDRAMRAIKKDMNRHEDVLADVRDIAQQGLDIAKSALNTAQDSSRNAAKSLRVAQAILKTVESIDGRLQSMQDHGQRLERLEDEVLPGGSHRGTRSRAESPIRPTA